MSNQGAEQVYYDNLAVTLPPATLLEEKHYNPYGLPIQGWGAISGYYKSSLVPQSQRPLELQGMLGAMAMMRILSGDAAGYATRTSGGGSGMLTSYEQLLQISYWQKQWGDETKRRGNGSRKYFSAGQGGFFSEDTAEDLVGATIDDFNVKENFVSVTLATGDSRNYSIAYEGTDFHLQASDGNDLLGWDGPIGRWLVPDFINVGIGFSGIFGLGAGSSIELNWVTHGPQASWKPVVTATQQVGVGYAMDGTINVGSVRYSGNASDIKRGMLATNTFGNGDKPTYWGAGALSAGVNVGVTGTYTPLDQGYLYGVQINFGAGLPAGPVPFNGAGGVSNTWVIYDFGK